LAGDEDYSRIKVLLSLDREITDIHELEDKHSYQHQADCWLPQYTLTFILLVVDEGQVVLFNPVFHGKKEAGKDTLQGRSP
jgi:hypothetical protein